MDDAIKELLERHNRRMRRIADTDTANTAKLAFSAGELLFEQAQVNKKLTERSRSIAEDLFNAVFDRSNSGEGSGGRPGVDPEPS